MSELLFNSAAGLHGGDLQAFNYIKKRFFCYQYQIFKTIIYSVGHETIYFEKYLGTAASDNLSDTAILIFRRYFRSSSLPVFCKVSVLKTSVKFLGKHMCWVLFSINLQTLSLKFYWKTTSWIFFNKKVLSWKHLFKAEAVVRRCSQKKMFLEISQNI